MWPVKYFKPEEVLSPLGLVQYNRGNLMLQIDALLKLDNFREFLGRPLICNTGILRLRGYRNLEENKRAGGAAYSRHMQGIAFDVHCPSISVFELFELAKKFGWPCVLKYASFIHVDNRFLLDGKFLWQIKG
jgi:hypothetical protein